MNIKLNTGGKLIANVIALLALTVFTMGCTSTSENTISASTSHNRADSVRDQNSQRADQTVSDTAPNPVAVAGQQNQIDTQRAGVVYQDNGTATSALSHPQPAQPTSAAQLASAAPAQASLGSPTENLANPDTMAYSQPDPVEDLARQRAEAVFSSMEHGVCKSGWGTPPDRLDASRITPEHPYYLELRLRNTPLFPVGHTYIAYGKRSPEGKLLSENMVMLSPVGGYGGAAIAAAIPVPGILTPLKDDCKIKPHAAYRVSLSAEQFEKLLVRIKQAQTDKPAYALFAYNCNHFIADIIEVVGILPAKNKYLPAVKYLYSLIEANEGFDPSKVRRG